MNFLQSQVARLSSDDEQQTRNITKLEAELETNNKAALISDSNSKTIQEELTLAKQQLKQALQQSQALAVQATKPTGDNEALLKSQLAQARADNTRLADEYAQLQKKFNSEHTQVLTDTQVNGDLAKKLSKQDQRIADLNQCVALGNHEIDKYGAGAIGWKKDTWRPSCVKPAQTPTLVGWFSQEAANRGQVAEYLSRPIPSIRTG